MGISKQRRTIEDSDNLAGELVLFAHCTAQVDYRVTVMGSVQFKREMVRNLLGENADDTATETLVAHAADAIIVDSDLSAASSCAYTFTKQ
jgi:hypothetical protein